MIIHIIGAFFLNKIGGEEMGNFVVIGANRFLGFHLCTALLENGEEVSGSVHKAHTSETSLQNEMGLLLGRNANFEKRTDRDVLEMITSETDAVYFAYFDGGDFYHDDFLREEMNNAYQTLRDVVKKCIQTHTKLIFTSSLRVFGKKQLKVREETKPEPDNSEGRLFLQFEQLIDKYREKGLMCIIVRIPNLYGPWQPLSMYYSQLLSNQKPADIREGTDYIAYIEDVVPAFLKCKEERANGNEVIHLLDQKIEKWEDGAQLLNKDYVEENSRHEAYEYSKKAKTLLNYETKTTLKEGIRAQRRHMRTFF